MATGFDSFDRSSLGAFIRSPLMARGGAYRTIPVDVSGLDWGYDVRDAFENVDMQTAPLALTDYACDSGGCSSDPSGTTNAEYGHMDFLTLDLDTEDYSTTSRYATPEKTWYLWTPPNPPTPCWGILAPYSAQNYASGARIPPTQDQVLYVAVYVPVYPLAADRNTGAPSCASGWGGTGTPPDDTVYTDSTGLASATAHWHLWKRTSASSAWAEYSAPFLPPSGYDLIQIDQTNGLAWGRISGTPTTLGRWALESDWSAASKTTFAIPSGNISGHAGWGRWRVVNSNAGNIYCYFDGSYVGALGSPHVAATWDWYDVAFGWLAVTYYGSPGSVQFWQLSDDGTFEHVSTVSATLAASTQMVGPKHAIGDTYNRFVYVDGAWSGPTVLDHIKSLSDDGYVWSDTMHGWVWLENGALSPKGYLAQVY